MHINETLIRSVVEQVISQVRIQAGSQGTVSSNPGSSNPGRGHSGLFDNVDDAVAAARSAFEQLQKRPIEDRKKIIDIIRRISISRFCSCSNALRAAATASSTLSKRPE